MEKTLNTIIVLRNDKSTDWANSDVILREGEVGVSYLDNGNVIVKAGNGTDKWPELKQVEGVFENPVTLTTSFGYLSVPTGGSKKFDGTNGTINTQGMTTTEFLMSALKKAIEPTISEYPAVSLSASCPNTGASLEIGSYITSVSYSTSVDKYGKYDTNGAKTNSGIKSTDFAWEVTLGDDAATKKTTTSGTWSTNIQINSTTANTVYATVKGTCTLSLDNVVSPTNNLGDPTSLKIKGFDAAGTTTKSPTAEVKASGYRNTWYYVGTDHTTAIDSTFVRGATPRNANTKNFNIHTYDGKSCLTIPGGTTRIMLAVPGAATLNSVTDIDGMGLDVKGNFTKTTVSVAGANGFEAANYTVFECVNSAGISATHYAFSIS